LGGTGSDPGKMAEKPNFTNTPKQGLEKLDYAISWLPVFYVVSFLPQLFRYGNNDNLSHR